MDPSPLTAARLRTLLDALAGNDPHEQHWAEGELADSLPDDSWQDQDWADQDWAADLQREREQHAA